MIRDLVDRVNLRVEAVSGLLRGRVFAEPGASSLGGNLVTFPHSKHDDQTDVLAYAALQIKQRRRRIRWVAPDNPNLRKPSGFGF